MADSTKVWYKSKGMWAGILTVVFGIYATVQATYPQFKLPDISQGLPIIFSVLGAFGIYGRLDASSRVTFTDQTGK